VRSWPSIGSKLLRGKFIYVKINFWDFHNVVFPYLWFFGFWNFEVPNFTWNARFARKDFKIAHIFPFFDCFYKKWWKICSITTLIGLWSQQMLHFWSKVSLKWNRDFLSKWYLTLKIPKKSNFLIILHYFVHFYNNMTTKYLILL